MKNFFEGVGSGFATGVWQDTPKDNPDFRRKMESRVAKSKKALEEIPS